MRTQEELSVIIAEYKAAKPYLFEEKRDVPLSEEHLCEIEHAYRIRLPDSFRQHLKSEGAGSFACGSVYSPDPLSGWSLWTEYALIEEDHALPRVLPFSDNGGGDYYCFPIADGICQDRVVWADHEDGYSVTDCECGDFRGFIVEVCLNPD